jgi:two-component system chemotaxis response regulator CheY
VREIRTNWPKTLIFMVSSELDAATIQSAHAMGVSGFIVKPFKADTVLNTIRNVVIAMVKRQRAAGQGQAERPAEAPPAARTAAKPPPARPPGRRRSSCR